MQHTQWETFQGDDYSTQKAEMEKWQLVCVCVKSDGSETARSGRVGLCVWGVDGVDVCVERGSREE